MYLPSQFQSTRVEDAVALMRSHPLAQLICVGDDGFPLVSHLPVHVVPQEGGFRLLAHCARGNPQWRRLATDARALVSFTGPQAYLSPKVYPDLQRVPTWNYLALACRVTVRLEEDPEALDVLLKQLIGDHEPAYAAQWRGLDEGFASRMLRAIVGLDMTVTSWSCKLKLNQHRPESHAAMHAAYAQGDDSARALAQWMEHLGLVAPQP